MDDEARIVLPNGFAAYAWEVEYKGVLLGAHVDYRGRSIPVTFYDPARLAQDVEMELTARTPFFEPNVIVLQKVTERAAIDAIQYLAENGVLDRFIDL